MYEFKESSLNCNTCKVPKPIKAFEKMGASILLKDGYIEAKAPKVSAFAVASYFATRNPEHEIIAREYIRKYVGMPVSLSLIHISEPTRPY